MRRALGGAGRGSGVASLSFGAAARSLVSCVSPSLSDAIKQVASFFGCGGGAFSSVAPVGVNQDKYRTSSAHRQ